MNRNILGVATAAILLMRQPAHADFRIVYPDEIDFGELEFEHNGSASFDHLPANSGEQSYTIEIGTGLTEWWHTEVELGFNRNPGFSESTLATQAVTENTFLFTEPGQYFADLGFYFEYGQSLPSRRNASANEITFGPLIAKDIGRTTHTINLFVTRQLGPDQTSQGLDFSYAWQSRWNIWRPLSPAVEFYGDAGTLGSSPSWSRQQFRVGPVGVGEMDLNSLGLGNAGTLKYEIGWLFGATRATPQGTLRWRLDLEIPF
jgi:hypothetical protein